ncbi:MAG: CHAT domain-containing tetratricopeptide repeat protein [Candidatus Melainabacteria bacterium]|nr:CHAT domain-containing tetratricopeptide repeat protein [Candidatus Melainabacteria bacterium]
MGKGSSKQNQQTSNMDHHGELAWEHLQAGEFEQACQEYETAIAVGRDLKQLRNVSVYLSYQAIAKIELKNAGAAETDLREAIALAHANGDAAIEGNAKLILGELLRDAGKLEPAIEQFLDAYDIACEIREPASAELALGNLGRLYLSRGWAEQACTCFLEALHQRDETRDKAALLGSLGLCWAELGKFDQSIMYYRTAYMEAEFVEDPQTMSVCRGSEGNTLFEIGSFKEALNCYEEALALSEQAEDPRRQGIWLGNLGTTWLKLGDADKALAFCTRAEEMARSNEDAQSQAAHLDSIGDCYVEKNDLEKAKEYYNQALVLSEQIEDRLGKRIYLANLGKLSEQIGQLQPAFGYLARAVDLFDEQRANIKADDLKTSFANRGEELYKNVVRVCLSLGKRVEALEYVGRAKSRALIDLLNNSPIDISHMTSSEDEGLKRLIILERELRAQIDRLERIFWQGPSMGDSGHRGASGAVSAEEAQKVYAEWRDVVNQLKRHHPNYADLVSSSTLGFKEIKALWNDDESRLLRDDTVIIEYFWTDEYLLAASVSNSQKEPVVHMLADIGDRDSLTEGLETFLEMSSTEGWEVPPSLCKRLYDQLLRPVLEGISQDIGRLVIVPHGSLFHLPFAALHDGESYLCKKYSFSYLPSTSLIPVLSRNSSFENRETSKYLVSAISDYSATRRDGLVFSSSLRSAAGLDDLSYTMEEARNILAGTTAENGKLITNEEVKENFSTLFGQYPVVHFAGHAVFNPEEPMASGLVLSDGTVLTAASILERSSLRTQVGRLLVLSACQTGVNMVTPGGEILGLARALMYAGMPNLVLSLWEVADRSTSDLMQDFHNHWQSGKTSIADALRAAQLKALESGQPIHAWAPFIHFGID